MNHLPKPYKDSALTVELLPLPHTKVNHTIYGVGGKKTPRFIKLPPPYVVWKSTELC